jgi:hypothetical protein
MRDTTISPKLIRQYQSIVVRQYHFVFLKQKKRKSFLDKEKKGEKEKFGCIFRILEYVSRTFNMCLMWKQTHLMTH